MSQFFVAKNARLSLSNNHDPNSPTVPTEYEISGCWNCGSEGWVSLPDGEGGHVTQICRICGGIGEIRQSTLRMDFNPDWIQTPAIYDLFFINSPLPLFFPGP